MLGYYRKEYEGKSHVNDLCKIQNQATARQAVEQAKKEEKNPFIWEGYVPLKEGGHAVHIWNLRDTGAIQSPIVEGILPLSEVTTTVRCKIFDGENFGKIENTKHWWIIFWRMPKIAIAHKIIIMYQLFTSQLES